MSVQQFLEQSSEHLVTALGCIQEPQGSIISKFLSPHFKVYSHGAYAAVLLDPNNPYKVLRVSYMEEDGWIRYGRWCLSNSVLSISFPHVFFMHEINGFNVASLRKYYPLEETPDFSDNPISPRWKEVKRACEILSENGLIPNDLCSQNIMTTQTGILKLIDPIA